MQAEIDDFLRKTPAFPGNQGTLNIPPIMAQITLFTAARSLQGQEVRGKLDTTFAKLYHDLDDGFQPINFMLPWMPLPQNRRRDIAQRKMTQIYTDIINTRRASKMGKDSEDMIWNLMNATYKDGTPLPDHEIAHMMIALLMGGQHNTSVTSSWIMLRLASKPHLIDELYNEQKNALGSDLNKPLAYDDLEKLPLMTYTIRETLRLHTPIHSIMRKVKNPMPIENTRWVVPPQNILLATPAAMGRIDGYFPNPMEWDPHRWDTMSNPEDQEKEKTDYGYGLVATGADSTYLPFGAGRHRCIGEKYAYLQLTIIIAVMVQKFRWRNVEGKEGVVGTDYSVSWASVLFTRLFCGEMWGVTDADECGWVVHVFPAVGARADSMGTSSGGGGEGVNVVGLPQAGDFFFVTDGTCRVGDGCCLVAGDPLKPIRGNMSKVFSRRKIMVGRSQCDIVPGHSFPCAMLLLSHEIWLD